MKRSIKLLQLFFIGAIISILFAACKNQVTSDKDLENLKKELFKKTSDISELPIYADPSTMDYEDFKQDKFAFQVDSFEIQKIKKYKNELEPLIIQRIDSGYCWVYLAAYLHYESAIPKIKDKLLKCDKFYGWEGPDYQKIESYFVDGQYCYQMAYIAAIEHISRKPLSSSIELTNQEYENLKKIADHCNENNIDNLSDVCYARWLLDKFNKK